MKIQVSCYLFAGAPILLQQTGIINAELSSHWVSHTYIFVVDKDNLSKYSEWTESGKREKREGNE